MGGSGHRNRGIRLPGLRRIARVTRPAPDGPGGRLGLGRGGVLRMTAPFTFHLPPELAAKEPPEQRGIGHDAVRLLVIDRAHRARRTLAVQPPWRLPKAGGPPRFQHQPDPPRIPGRLRCLARSMHRGSPGRAPARRHLARPALVPRQPGPVRLRRSCGRGAALLRLPHLPGARSRRRHPASLADPLLQDRSRPRGRVVPNRAAGALQLRLGPLGLGLLPDRVRAGARLDGDAFGGPLFTWRMLLTCGAGDRDGLHRVAHHSIFVHGR